VTLGSGFLTAGGNNLSTTNSSVISGTGGFTKAGTGVLIFTKANTYTGNTVVSAGTLAALKQTDQVLGSLADRIRVPDRYVAAVETALGHCLQLVLTEQGLI